MLALALLAASFAGLGAQTAHAQTEVCVDVGVDADLCLTPPADIVLTTGDDLTSTLPAATGGTGCPCLYWLEGDVPTGLFGPSGSSSRVFSGTATVPQAETTLTYIAEDKDASGTVEVTFTITVEDPSEPTLSVLDIDNFIQENQIPPVVVGPVPTVAGFPDGTRTWSIISGNTGNAFTIDDTGQISSAIALDFETASSYTLTVQLEQGGATATVDIEITVRDINDTPVANAGDDQAVNSGQTVTLTGSATDEDEGAENANAMIDSYSWSAPAAISFTGATGSNLNEFEGQTATFTAPDVSESTEYRINLVVRDGSGLLSATSDPDEVVITVNPDGNAAVTLDDNVAGDNIINIDEKAAGFAITGTTEAGASVSVTLGTGSARTATVNSDDTWTVDIPMDAPEITGTSVEVVATATLSGKANNTARRDLTVDLEAPTATYATPTLLRVGQTITTITPGSPSPDVAGYAVQSGTLPPGLTLDGTTGAISGTPTTANAAQAMVTIRLTDEAGNTSDRSLTFPAVSLGSQTVTGFSYSPASVGLSGAAPTLNPPTVTPAPGGALSYSASPAGVCTVDPATGALTLVGTGICSVTVAVASTANHNAVTSTFAVTITDDSEVSVTRDTIAGDDVINIAERASGFAITGTVDAGASITVAVGSSVRFAAVDGTDWRANIGGDLPQISGTSFRLDITAMISGRPNGRIREDLVVDLVAPTATWTAPASLAVDVPITTIMPGSPSSDVASYAVQSGALPPGLTLDGATGAISGTPTTVNAATAAVTIRLTDDAGNPNDVSVTFPAVGKSAQTLSGFAYTPASVRQDQTAPTLTAPSGVQPGSSLTYASSTTDVCTVDSATGALTLVGAGACMITATASETATHNAGTATFTVTVTATPTGPNTRPPPPPVEDQSAIAGREFSYQFDAVVDPDGGTVAYEATLSGGGALPGWLSFAAGTRTFSGTPQAADAGTIAVRVTATDDHSTPLSSMADFTITVEAVTVSIADASGPEDASLVFTVTLSHTPAAPVTVDWSTSPGTALDMGPEADFTGSMGTVTFPANATEDGLTETFSVAVVDDELPEQDESFTVTLEVPSGSPLPDGVTLGRATATGTIRANDGGGAPTRLSRVSEEVLPRVAQALTAGPLSAITGRIESAASGGLQPQVSNLAGRPNPLQALRSSGRALEDGTLDLEQVLDGTSFVLPLDAAEGDGSAGAGGLAVWGSADYRRLSGPDGSTVDWDGGLFNVQLGADVRVRPGLLAGVAVSGSSGSVDYSDRTGNTTAEGSYDTRMASVHPYVSWSPSGDLGLWAALGYGQGEIEIEEAGGPDRQSDMEMRMAAVGASHRLLSHDGLTAGGTATLRLKGEGSTAQIDIDGGDQIRAAGYDVQRLRVSLEGRYECPPGASGGCLAPSVEVGARHDSGDGATGTGVELGAALRYTNRAAGVTAEGRGRALVAGQDGRGDWGFGGLIRIDPGADRLGLSLSLTPGFGDAAGRAERLYDEGLPEAASGSAPAGRLDTEVGYGFAGPDGVLTPYTGVSLVDTGSRRYRLGGRFVLGQAFSLILEGARWEGRTTAPGHGIMMRGRLSW